MERAASHRAIVGYDESITQRDVEVARTKGLRVRANLRDRKQMQKSGIAHPEISKMRHVLHRRITTVLLATAGLLLISAATDRIAAQKSHKQSTTPKSPLKAPQTPPAPPEQALPQQPDWPANDKPAAANVSWNSKGLRVEAKNSSLVKILKDVATATGAKISGMGADQRVFGTYGPGPARDVISQLLEGSGYNVLLIGDQGQGTPRQIVLSRQPTGPAPAPNNNPASSYDDGGNADVEEPQPPPPPPPPQQPQQPQPNPPNAPGAQPRTPQQILQEMQQRQQQIEQQQQQQRTNPQ